MPSNRLFTFGQMAPHLRGLRALPPSVMFVFLATIQGVIWYWLASPYRPFPSDDVGLFQHGGPEFAPLFLYYLKVTKELSSLLSLPAWDQLLLQAILANGVAFFSLAGLVRTLTRSTAAALAAGLAFATSPWVATYYFFSSYASFSGAMILTSLYGVLLALRLANEPEKKKLAALIPGGFALGLSSYSASGGALPVACILLSLVAAPPAPRPPLKARGALCLGALLGFLSGFPYWRQIFIHLKENIHTYHYEGAMQRFGEIPKPPLFTFFWVNFVFSPSFLVLLMGVIALTVAQMWKRKNSRPARLFDHLLWAILLFSFLLEVLPFTRNGRSLYPAYLLCLLFVFSVAGLNFPAAPKWTQSLAKIYCIVLVTLQAFLCRDLIESRMPLPRLLERLPPASSLLMAKGDPNGRFFSEWLGKGAFMIPKLVDDSETRPPHVFILSPHGKNSGKNFLEFSVSPDFFPELKNFPRPSRAIALEFPFFGYFPLFLMEEEISQALYFRGEIPDYYDRKNWLQVWIW